VFGVRVSESDRSDWIVHCIVEAGRARRPLMVSALSVHALMLAATRPEMGRAIARAGIVTTDGQPVRWAMNALHGSGLRRRVCGPDLMLAVCAEAARAALPIYLYGSKPGVLAALERSLGERCPGLQIAGVDASRIRPRIYPPPTDEPEDRADVERIRTSGARILLVGLGCPLQELWAAAHADALSMPVLCVGAAFDFHAGLLERAPQAMQDLGLEWVFRLWRDPRRLFARYARYNTLFLVRLFRELVAARLQPALP
jgi:exopolysaccharide biosynthesis WecB/TagA/CpsF family protein